MHKPAPPLRRHDADGPPSDRAERAYRVRAVMRRGLVTPGEAKGQVAEVCESKVYPAPKGDDTYTYDQAVDVLSIFYKTWADYNRRAADEPVAIYADTGGVAFTYSQAISAALLPETLRQMAEQAAQARETVRKLNRRIKNHQKTGKAA